MHKECDIMDEDALLRLQGAWETPQQKDECSVRMDDLDWDYWMGTEVGQLGGYGFQGAFFGVDGSCKDGTMGSGCCKFQEEEADKCARVGRKEDFTNSNWPELMGIVLALQSSALSEDVLLLCDNAAVLCAIKKWVGQGVLLKRKAGWAHSGIKKSVINLARRKSCGKQREMKK